MYQPRELERIARRLVTTIEDELVSTGLFFRIFHRVKDGASFEEKMLRKGPTYYDGKKKFIRDIIGIRVIFYFSDDVDIVYDRLKHVFDLVEETIDRNEETKFAPTRINLIFKLPAEDTSGFNTIVANPKADSTFEIQLRTILSEGWHEVDHDLRYKCQDDWNNHTDIARNFNGILAAIETSEYTILRLFEQLSYRHYKSKDLSAMIRTKFRLRFSTHAISEELKECLTDEILKQIFKIDRLEVLSFIYKSQVFIPLTIDNLIYIINHAFIKDQQISSITPQELLQELKE